MEGARRGSSLLLFRPLQDKLIQCLIEAVNPSPLLVVIQQQQFQNASPHKIGQALRHPAQAQNLKLLIHKRLKLLAESQG